jgi:hypothetical protein
VTIIPLAPASRPGSSDLPEGSSFLATHAAQKGAPPLSRLRPTSRASSPLLFGLAPRGVCRASVIAGGAVGSYPTFSPLPANHADIPKVFLRAITGLRSTGGIFSVALSVTQPLPATSPGVTRRAAQRCPDFPPALPYWPSGKLRPSRRSSSSPAISNYSRNFTPPDRESSQLPALPSSFLLPWTQFLLRPPNL